MEIQDEKPRFGVRLDCVGFRGVRKLIKIRSEAGDIALDSVIDVCVSVPSSQRGAHLSRNYYAILDAINSVERASSIERYLEKIAENLLALHPYATQAIVGARTTYYVPIEHEGLSGVEPVEVEVEVAKERAGAETWSVGVRVTGITACPSAQRTIAELANVECPLPPPTHSQKAVLRVRVTSTPRGILRVEELARTAVRAFSAPAFSYLRRSMEAKLVLSAHSNPKLAEDVARDALLGVAELLEGRGYPDDTLVAVEVVSYESIHPHNVYVRTSASLGELRTLLANGSDRDLD